MKALGSRLQLDQSLFGFGWFICSAMLSLLSCSVPVSVLGLWCGVLPLCVGAALVLASVL